MTEFIMENNIWLIIFGILIFMAMIGYSVEKKRETKKNDKTDNKKGKDREIKIESTSDIPVVDPIEPTSVPTIMVEGNSMETGMEEKIEDIPATPIGLDDLMISDSMNTTLGEENPSVVTATGEDLSVPLEAVETSVPIVEDGSAESMTPELSSNIEPIPGEVLSQQAEEVMTDMTSEIVPPVEEPQVETLQSQQDTTAADLGMDDISYLFTETKKEEETPTEDVWKF